jgi:hypothetical protein
MAADRHSSKKNPPLATGVSLGKVTLPQCKPIRGSVVCCNSHTHGKTSYWQRYIFCGTAANGDQQTEFET